MTEQQLRIKMLRQVALRADGFYDQAKGLGEKAARALTGKRRSQINNLEGIANSALKTSDVFDFIKTRTARHKEWDDWGPDLLAYLSGNLRTNREQICKRLAIDVNSADGLEVHLMLIREFVRQLSAHYEYVCWETEEA